MLFRINPENRESQALTEVDFADLGLRERAHIQEWIAAHPSILGDDLLIIGKEFSEFEGSRERPDLLAVDTDGKLVVIELKRDDSGEDVHWQAIKYASYFSHAKVEQIVGMLARYRDISELDSETALLQYLDAADLDALNHDQRIILVSHRFAPAAASAVLWLNKKASIKNLITCIQLTPYRDEQANSLHLHASTIIPVSGIATVGVGSSPWEGGSKNPNTNDEVTHFMRSVSDLVKNELPDEMKPDRTSRWAGSGEAYRYYAFFYSQSPWRRYHTEYEVHLYPPSEQGNWWEAHVFFHHDPRDGEADFDLQDILNAIDHSHEWQVKNNLNQVLVELEGDALNDDFAGKTADVLRQLIETITPVVNNLASKK